MYCRYLPWERAVMIMRLRSMGRTKEKETNNGSAGVTLSSRMVCICCCHNTTSSRISRKSTNLCFHWPALSVASCRFVEPGQCSACSGLEDGILKQRYVFFSISRTCSTNHSWQKQRLWGRASTVGCVSSSSTPAKLRSTRSQLSWFHLVCKLCWIPSTMLFKVYWCSLDVTH